MRCARRTSKQALVCLLLAIAWGRVELSQAQLLAPAASAETEYKVGLARVDITPDHPIRLCGFWSRQTESEGVRQRLYARVLAVKGSGKPAVLVSVDSIGIPAAVRTEVARRLLTKRQLEAERLAICSTHSHTAPCLSNVLPTMFAAPIPGEHQARIDRYTSWLTDRIEQAALQALDNLQPGRLKYAIGQVDFAINRRQRGGPVDHDLPVLAVVAPDGSVRGLWVGYACHCVVISDYQISGDWAGYASEALEKIYPASVALVSIGCGADANPEARGTEDIARQYGMQIAAEVKRLLDSEMAELEGELHCELQSIRIPLSQPPSRDEWVEQAKAGGIDGYYARYQIEKLDCGEELPTEVPYPIQCWRFGESLACVFLSGEVVVDYSLRLKREFDSQRLWVTAYANDIPCYIPSERVLKEGGYEAGVAMHFYGLPAWFAPGLEDKILNVVRRQLGDDFRRIEERSSRRQPPMSPEESAAAIRVSDDLRVELVASEPLIRDPVAIDFGPDGKLWVAEMRDYGCQDGEDCPPIGQITVLEDRDTNGQFETATTFLDRISCPMGVTVWRNGVLICAAPDVLYAEDTTGDGKADKVEKLLSGFGTQHPQARVNGFAYGLDGWLYAACSFGGTITKLGGHTTHSLPDSDFRWNPTTGNLEIEAGRTQQSRVRDDWGNWFGCNNSVLCWHYPLSERYLRRNPHVLPPTLSVPVASRKAATLYPPGPLVLWELSGPAGKATAACGMGIYRDELLGPEYSNNVFTCEPVHQIVHRMVLTPTGTTFVGERPSGEADREFLSSTDNWFRPVQARTGPDGALWVVDMYRYVIEHSRWIPPSMLSGLDVRAGASRGRIYRVLPKDSTSRPFLRLLELETPQLVAALDSPNGWQRDMVQQLIAWRGDTSAALPLARLAMDSSRPAVRLQALSTLASIGELQSDHIQAALNDSSAAVRRQAVQLVENRLDDFPELLDTLVSLANDADPHVALQLACSLGQVEPSATTLAILAAIARGHADDPYVLAAVLTSIRPDDAPLLIQGSRNGAAIDIPLLMLAKLIELIASTGDAREIDQMVTVVVDVIANSRDTRRFSLLAGLLRGIRQNEGVNRSYASLDSAGRIEDLLKQCMDIMSQDSADIETRTDCIQALGFSNRLSSRQIRDLAGLLEAERHPKIQLAALDALAMQRDDLVAGELVDRWHSLTPTIRDRTLEVFLSRTEWVMVLLDSVTANRIPLSDLDASHRYRIGRIQDERIQRKAKSLLSTSTSGERAAVVARYESSVPTGDAARGRSVFERNCATCHEFRGTGNKVGPDVAALNEKSYAALVREILDPNRAVDQRYLDYVALTTDGRVRNGILAEETGNSITLLGEKGKMLTLLRSELESLTSSGKSLMPEGFENQISPQDMADLIQFLMDN